MREYINSGVSGMRACLNYGDTQNERIQKIRGIPKMQGKLNHGVPGMYGDTKIKEIPQ